MKKVLMGCTVKVSSEEYIYIYISQGERILNFLREKALIKSSVNDMTTKADQNSLKFIIKL